MKRFMLATVGFGALALGSAQAVPFNGTYGVTIYQTSNGGGVETGDLVQANLTNPLRNPAAQIASFTYSGPLNFAHLSNNETDTFGNFFVPGNIQGGTFAGGVDAFLGTQLSSGTFQRTSLFDFVGTYSGTLTGTVTHDDGVSLFYGPNNTPTAAISPMPTTVQSNAYTLPGSDNTFRLVYVAANGTPSILTLDVASSTPVPEPMSLALLGIGLIGAGMVRRRSA